MAAGFHASGVRRDAPVSAPLGAWVHFEIQHEFDAPLDAVELAVLSPDLAPLLARSLESIESIETIEHEFVDGELRRVLLFQAASLLPMFRAHRIAKSAMCWHERSTYRLADHRSTWKVTPRDEWARYVRSEGTYELEPVAGGRTRRTVRGDIEVRLRVLGLLVERMAVAEVKKTYDAEADTLRQLATL
jgi:hypothetical protein